MKKPEPLDLKGIKEWVVEDKIIKDYYIGKLQMPIHRAINLTTIKIKQRIKKACEFYSYYEYKPALLVKEHPEYEEEVMNFYKLDEEELLLDLNEKRYNEWLFKKAFKPIFKNANT